MPAAAHGPARSQTGVQLYGLAPPATMDTPYDVAVVATTRPGQPVVAVYCNPAYGQYLVNGSQPSNYPREGFAVWQSSAPHGSRHTHLLGCALTRLPLSRP